MATEIGLGIQKLLILKVVICNPMPSLHQSIEFYWTTATNYEVLLRVTHQLSITTKATNLY